MDVLAIAAGRWLGGALGSALEDALLSGNLLNESASPPNPNGRNGGPEHQGTVDDVERDMQDRGLDTDREYHVPTPEGEKSCRFCDVVGKDPETGEVREMVQVGRQTQTGNPVAREIRALDDIQNATGTRPRFVPYN